MKKTRVITSHRKDYAKHTLSETSVNKNPVKQFMNWLHEASDNGVPEPHAFTFSTADKKGKPSARILLLRDVGDKGFSFFTNYKSRKGQELEENPFGAMTFFWQQQERQVRIEGKVVQLDKKLSDEYFNSRPLSSRIGAWASPQSEVISGREMLDKRYAGFGSRFGTHVPRPPHWGGYILKPTLFEFWQGRPNRLHDRILYTLVKNNWCIQRLAP